MKKQAPHTTEKLAGFVFNVGLLVAFGYIISTLKIWGEWRLMLFREKISDIGLLISYAYFVLMILSNIHALLRRKS